MRHVVLALVIACGVVVMFARSRTIRLEGDGPLGKIDVRVKVAASLNGIGPMMKGGGFFRKRVEEILVKHQNEPGTWVTRDKGLRLIGDWDRRVAENGWCRISGGCLYAVMDGKRLNNGTSAMIIGLPERRQRVTRMEYWGGANDRACELVWLAE